MRTVKTSELTDIALDWAVNQARDEAVRLTLTYYGKGLWYGDTIDGKTRVSASDPRVDQRVLSVPVQNVNGKLLVPVVEFMGLFGRRVNVE